MLHNVYRGKANPRDGAPNPLRRAVGRIVHTHASAIGGRILGWYSQTLPPLTSPISEGRSGNQSGSHEGSFRVVVYREGSRYKTNKTTHASHIFFFFNERNAYKSGAHERLFMFTVQSKGHTRLIKLPHRNALNSFTKALSNIEAVSCRKGRIHGVLRLSFLHVCLLLSERATSVSATRIIYCQNETGWR